MGLVRDLLSLLATEIITYSQTTFREIDRTYQVDQLSVNRVEAQCSSFKNVFEIIL